jgi:LL-diaminopimelate aminotransferase
VSVDGAIEVGAEIHSLSKAFNMTGWRLGFIAGNKKLIAAYGTVKDNTDSGQFRAIQKAGIYGLKHPEITDRIKEKYSRRFNMLVKVLKEVGFDAKKPQGSFYCYVGIPKGTKNGTVFHNAKEVMEYLIRNAFISTIPWDDAGAFLRISVTFEAAGEEEERKIIEEIRERLMKLELVFD